MRKYGFKLFSDVLYTAPNLFKGCVDFANNNSDIFFELMVIDKTSEHDLLELKNYSGNIEVRIHVPHNIMGFDLGNKNIEMYNKSVFALSQMAADIFNSKTIVVHPGCGHEQDYINETIRQLKLLNDKRIVVENMPLYASNLEPLQGNTANEIKYIMDEVGCGFCFDFSHAICAALELKVDIEKHLKDFFDLKPDVYHMCDGNINIPQDLHMHFGSGNYPLKHFVNDYTKNDAYITIETGKGVSRNPDMWIQDYQYIKAISK